MISLPELQHGFLTAVMSGNGTGFSACIEAAAGGVSADERLEIYRNNWQQGFIKALAIGYPVVERLVGAAYFAVLARELLAVSPSRCGDLNQIGAPFADFLRRKFSGTEYDYLPDVAALECLCQGLQIAAEEAPATVDDLRSYHPNDYAGLQFRLCPTTALLQSPYPVTRIWLSNQPEAAPEVIDLRSGGEELLIRYRQDTFEFHRLRPAEFAMAQALGNNATLADALGVAIQIAADFDAAQALSRMLGAGALLLETG
jgi:hypothetical protein